MEFQKITDKQGQFIVIIKSGLEIIEVHSNGNISQGNDDRDSMNELVNDAYANALHSQTTGNGVVLDT